MSQRIRIIGAGVCGLTTGITLAERGFDVDIWTKERVMDTTSATAAGFWEPYIVEPAELAAQWGKASFDIFTLQFAQHGSAIGIEPRTLYSIFREYPERPIWADAVPTFRRMDRDELCSAFEGDIPEEFAHGFCFDTWMVEMGKYLPYLQARFERSGDIHMRNVTHINEAFNDVDGVVNCSGLGSRDIGGIEDRSVYPIAGQVVQIPRTCEKSILFDTLGAETEKPTYIVTRGDNVILGGTAVAHSDNRTPSADVSHDIVERCQHFFSHIDPSDVQVEKVGLRPARPTVRLESQAYGDKVLLHNYGHGGAGVTLCWGCAEDVASLVHSSISNTVSL